MQCTYTKGMMTGLFLAGMMKTWKAMCYTPMKKMAGKTPVQWKRDCATWSGSHKGQAATETKTASREDIVGTAAAAPAFSTLVKAVQASGLEDLLRKTGPFTVFAPQNEAFEAVPAETLEELLKPENQASLQRILGYHIVPGRYTAADVGTLESASTLNGQSVSIRVENGEVLVNDARVVKTDVIAQNGVIHVINRVLMPDQN